MVATEIDTGPVILGILKSQEPEKYHGKLFYLASEWVTLPQIAAAYSRGALRLFPSMQRRPTQLFVSQ